MDDDPLEQLKRMKAQQADPLEQLKALRQRPASRPGDANNQATPGELTAAHDAESVSLPRAFLHSALATGANLAEGIPGMERVQAGARAVVRGQPYSEALGDIRGQTDKLPAALKVGERIAGALPLARFLPGSAIKAGSLIGGLDAALSADQEGSGERALKTAAGAGIGAAGGAVLKGIGNVAQRSGVTDVIGSGLRKAGNRIGDAIGTTGAANQLLGQRQQVLDRLSGSEQSAAQTMLDHIDQYKTQAKALYDRAAQDQTVINDPRVNSALNDHRVQQMLQMARERLGITPTMTEVAPAVPGSPSVPSVPRQLALSAPGVAPEVPSGAPQSTREAIAAFHARAATAAQRTEGTAAQQQAREALERRGAEASLPAAPPSVVPAALNQPSRAVPMVPDKPAVYADIPTPEEVAMTKRILNSVVQGKFNAPQGINTAEAAQMAPLLDNLRSALHDASPAWKDADAFYTHAKNFESAYQKGYGVQQRVTASGLDPNKLKTPDALTAWIDKRAGTPLGLARASGVQAGTAGRLGEAVKAAPLDPTFEQTMQGANGLFQPSQNAAAVRRLAFSNQGDAQLFAGLLGSLGKESAGQSFGPSRLSLGHPWQMATQFGTAPNPLTTPAGVDLRAQLAARLADPAQAAAIRDQIARSTSGRGDLTAALRALFAGGNAAIGRP